MTNQNTQPGSIRWGRVTALVASIVGLLLLFLAFLTFNAPALLLSFVAAIVGLVFGIRTRHEVAITIAVLAVLGGIALIVSIAAGVIG